jgi:hypothetical protein
MFQLCTPAQKPVLEFSLTENAGISRPLEYITLDVHLDRELDDSEGICIQEQNNEDLILGQILDFNSQANDKITYTCLFPVAIEANSTIQYKVFISENGRLHNEQLMVEGNGTNIKIENAYFIADLTDIKASEQNGLGSGQLAGLVLKQFQDKLLERSHINMHWAPNFQKEELPYKTFGHITDPDTTAIIRGPYKTTIYKAGRVEGYEEILITGTYEFFAGLPYFLFSSEIRIEKDVELMLLRNDEMTMDSLFTHLGYMHLDGTTDTVALYDDQEIQSLEEDPIKDDATWLFFFHDALNYGFGSIRLYYDNTNIHGESSPLYQPHTKITRSANNGRYWNRRLVHDHNTMIPEGSRYKEKNAYLVFKAHPEDPSREIVNHHKRLMNSLEIKILSDAR